MKCCELDGQYRYRDGLRASRAGNGDDLDSLAGLQGLVAFPLNRAGMHEAVGRAVIRRDEAVATLVEPAFHEALERDGRLLDGLCWVDNRLIGLLRQPEFVRFRVPVVTRSSIGVLHLATYLS